MEHLVVDVDLAKTPRSAIQLERPNVASLPDPVLDTATRRAGLGVLSPMSFGRPLGLQWPRWYITVSSGVAASKAAVKPKGIRLT